MKKKAAYRSLFCLIVDWQSYFLYFWRLIISFMQIGETYEHTTNSSELYCGQALLLRSVHQVRLHGGL